MLASAVRRHGVHQHPIRSYRRVASMEMVRNASSISPSHSSLVPSNVQHRPFVRRSLSTVTIPLVSSSLASRSRRPSPVVPIRQKSVFVSKHNQSLNVSPKTIIEYCETVRIVQTQGDYKVTASHVILKECPFCHKPTNNKADNQFKCYICNTTGTYMCHRCGTSGSWFDFKLSLSPGNALGATVDPSGHQYSTRPSSSSLKTNTKQTTTTPQPLPMPHPTKHTLYSSALLDADDPPRTLHYLKDERGLHEKTLRHYGVGHASYRFPDPNGNYVETDCVCFPWIMSVQQVEEQEKRLGSDYQWRPTDEVVGTGNDENKKPLEELKQEVYLPRRIKVRSVAKKSWQRLEPSGGGWGLFGLHTVPHHCTEIVLTEGEYDAMAVYQATKRPTLSLPNGCRSLPVEALALLERFTKIYLWMDNDAAGQEGAESFAKKIGLQRTYFVRPTLDNCELDGSGTGLLPKDANEALLKGFDLEKIVSDAKLIPHEQITQFAELRADVLHEILYPEQYVGAPISSLPTLTSILKGVRRGELTVITGPTGSGKTTFLGQMSMDLVEQDVNVLWGSFEIKNTRLLHKLLQQFARKPLPTGDPAMAQELNALADRFEQLPYYFMKFHGGSDVDAVLDAMDYAVYVNDVEHIILDNMQFMVSLKNQKSSFDKFDVQDMAIEKFRKFATDRNVHVTLVVHPRKEQENSSLSLSSIYGSAKATQEADTVLILQNDGKRKYMEVKKNRFNGSLGHAPLHFDRKSCRYVEEPTVEVNSGKKKPAPVLSGEETMDPWEQMFSGK